LSAIHSSAYSLGSKILQLVISFGSLAILGRLLTPEDFGVFGLILAVQVLFAPVLDMGLMPAYLTLDSVDETSNNVFHTINVLLGIFNSIFLIVLAPVLTLLYKESVLMPLVMVFALSIIVGTLSRQGGTELVRRQRFDKILIIDIVSLSSGVVAAIYGALNGLGVWALALRALVVSSANFIIVRLIWSGRYHLAGWKEIKKFKGSFVFGGEIVISRLFNGALLSMDKFFFGSFFSVSALGQYMKAVDIAIMPDTNLRMALVSPALAHIARSDSKEKTRNYEITSQVILIIAGFPCLILIVMGDWLLPWLMGPQWIEAGKYAQVLGIWCMGRVMCGIAAVLYLNEKRSRHWAIINGVAILFILVPPVTSAYAGFSPMQFVVFLSLSSVIFWSFILMGSLSQFTGSFMTLRHVSWSFIITIMGGLLSGFIVKSFIRDWANLSGANMVIGVLCLALIMFFIVIFALLFLDRSQSSHLYGFIRMRLKQNDQKVL
jgi:PST family polysaccharide transporter